MAQYTSYDQVGKKEDISDVISTLTPTKVPFQAMIGNERIKNTLFQWQEDELRAVQVNAKIEGFTASDATLSPTTMRSNYSQILEKTIKISETADAIDTYGRARESAYQLSKAGAELRRDLEHAMVGTKQTAVAGDSSTARKFAGFQAQVAAGNFTYTGTTGTPAVANALDEDDFLAAMQDLYNEGSDPSVAMVTPSNSLIVADFAKASGRSRDINNGRQVVNAVDLYVSPFGEVKIYLNRFLAAGDTLIFDPEMWKQCTLRPWARETLAKDGDNMKMMIVGEYSLKHKNQKASAVIREGAAP